MIPAGLTVIQVLPTPDTITIVATSDASTAACPSCGRLSRRVHSTYERRLQDLPWQGRAVVIRVRARRFRCSDLACARQTFAEPLSAATVRRSWRTCRLGDLQRHIGLAAGGEAGSRLARRLAMPVSPDTLLRLVTQSPMPVTPVPKVLAVDEWAWRKGHRYGLADVLGAMKGTLLDSLATSLERDVAAVQAALDTPWTTSPAEGQINRLKTLKRAMYGRAGFPLLRARVLHAA